MQKTLEERERCMLMKDGVEGGKARQERHMMRRRLSGSLALSRMRVSLKEWTLTQDARSRGARHSRNLRKGSDDSISRLKVASHAHKITQLGRQKQQQRKATHYLYFSQGNDHQSSQADPQSPSPSLHLLLSILALLHSSRTEFPVSRCLSPESH